MGLVIGRFKKKPTTVELLEKLEDEIQAIEEFRQSTERSQRKMIGRFLIISICVYVLTAFIFYFYFFPATPYERIIYTIPLIVTPIIVLTIKRILGWYYSRKMQKNQTKLSGLKNTKKKILEEVMDKETYKVARLILEKFAPDQIKRSVSLSELTPAKPTISTPPVATTARPELRHRQRLGVKATPQNVSFQSAKPRALDYTAVTASKTPMGAVLSTPLPMPRAILAKDRSVLDRMVDFLIGDGPSNRYALICKTCSHHNGMATIDEFDYLSFRCCYCLHYNPALKQRPLAPKLATDLKEAYSSSEVVSGTESESESGTESESESVKEEVNLEEVNNSNTAAEAVATTQRTED